MSMRRLPFEVVALVVGYLGLDDVHNLSICSRHFRFLAYDQTICRRALQASAASALEAQQALSDGDYARGLRRFVKRREAISSAYPFLTAVVAFAETWLYENGVLCHIRERQLRLLDVHHSAAREIVVDIRKLLDEAILESRSSRKYKFQLLYQAHGVVSCLYTHARPQLAHWLVVFNPSERSVITTRRLGSAYKIFARNNSDFLYYGVQSDIGNDAIRRWVLQGFDIRKGEWLADSLSLPDTVGSEIDVTICFEIIDGYFCVLTNHTSFELERIEYTSYYDFFRFPLDRPSHEHMERPTKRNLFRRQHSEGPIDDRWTFMKIFSDDLSGELKIVESRKEWLSGNSSATRTYYTKALQLTETGQRPRSSHASDEEDEDEDEDQYTENDRLAQFLEASSKSQRSKAPERDASEVHVGDNAATSVMFTLSKSFIRSYHPASQAFLDLVDDPRESQPCEQRIRIRAGSRLPRARSNLCLRPMCNPPNHAREQMNNAQQHSGVASWPPDSRSPALDELHSVLNPPGYAGNVHGTWDQRSLVYATGGERGASGSVKALVLVSFDPCIKLKGVMPFDEGGTGPSSEGNLEATLRDIQDMLASGKGRRKDGEQNAISTCPLSADEEVIVEHKRSASSAGSGFVDPGSGGIANGAQMHPWASEEPAQYLTIGWGFHFAK